MYALARECLSIFRGISVVMPPIRFDTVVRLAGRCQSQKQANAPQPIFTHYLRRMLAAGVSKYDPDPMPPLASAYEFC
jgi:hypothetical protein